MDKKSFSITRRPALRGAAVFLVSAVIPLIILLASGENRFTLACVLPFVFIAVAAPVLAARIVSTDTQKRNTATGFRLSGYIDFGAFVLGLIAGHAVAAFSVSLFITVVLAVSFTLSISGLVVLLSLVMRPALAVFAGSAAGFIALLSPIHIGPLLRHSGAAARQLLLSAAYWLNPMAIATHAGLGRDFFRFRGGPVSFYDLGVADYVYSYPGWWAVAFFHAAAGCCMFAFAMWIKGSRRSEVAGQRS